jgi:hypothetical protein
MSNSGDLLIVPKKDKAESFNVFFSYNSADKPAVDWTAKEVREQGIRPWLCHTELAPGRPWRKELKRQIRIIGAAAVFVGPKGLGRWQEREVRLLQWEFMKRGCPVIPVLLPGAAAPVRSRFLRGMTWVDLRTKDPAEIERLVFGITGRKPRR